jgi:hypothetical protein
MALEVYLLSIPLARHRQIVPRPPRSAAMYPDEGVQGREQRERTAMQSLSAPSASTLQRLDCD